ncbi:MAG: cell division protein SepF [Clostridia bacterium]|nr:cell division protein SepF [Clostridia bacterium]
MAFNDWLGRRGEKKEEIEYYEDTHNEKGEYIGKSNDGFDEYAPRMERRGRSYSAPEQERPANYTDQNYGFSQTFENAPPAQDAGFPKSYNNIVVYYPQTPEDVQALIDYLKRKEPAIINLDDVQPNIAQRILDFLSGAIYGLNGSVHRISGNIFLLSPQGVEITMPYAKK